MRNTITRLGRVALLVAPLGAVAVAQQAPPRAGRDSGNCRRTEGRRFALADVRRQLRQPSVQPAHADHAGERQRGCSRSGRSRRRRSATSKRRRSCATTSSTSPARRTWRGRSTRARATDLALSPRAAARADRLLRPRQPRLRRARRQAVHDDARRPSARARHEDRRHRLGCHDGGLQERLRLDARAARRQGQGDRRRRRRRVRHPRIHRRLRRADRQAGVALLHDSRARRAGQQHLGGRFVEERRIGRLGDRRVRSGAESASTRHRQSGSRLSQREPRGRQPVQLLDARARRRHRQAQLALPVHAARRARLGFDRGADPRRHHRCRTAAQGR